MAQDLFDTSNDGINQYTSRPQQATAPAPSVATTIASSGVAQGLGSLIGGLVQGATVAKKEAAQRLEDKSLSDYARKITSLNAAVEQGTLKQSEAQRQQRALYSSMVANNPAITEKLTAFSKGLSGTAGLGDTLAEGTAVDQQIVADTKTATAQGFITPGMTQEEQENGLNLYRQRQQQLGEMEFYSKQLGIQQQRLSMQASQESIAASRVQRANAAADLTLKKNKLYAQQSLADFGNNAYQHTQTQLADIQKRLAAGQLNNEQALAESNALKDQLMGQMQKIRGAVGGDYADSIAKPIFDSIDARNKFLSGQISADTLKTQLDTLEAKSALPFMSDPKMAGIIAAGKFLGGVTNPALIGEYGDYMASYLKKNSVSGGTPTNPLTDDPDEKASTKAYTGSLKDVTQGLKNKNPAINDPKGTFDELQTHVNQLIKGVGSFSGAHNNPKDYNEVVDYLADPSFLDYQKMGGRIDQSNLESVKIVISVNYLEKLVPAVQKEWEQGNAMVGAAPSFGAGMAGMVAGVSNPAANIPETAKAEQTLQYIWTGSTIEFRPAKGYENNPGVRAKAGELQRKLAPVINKSVMMRAHLDGSNDYNKYFKLSEAEMFGVKEAAPTENSVNGR
ncbi:hemagglutinin protein [Trabulsiella guamensis ATCC 49490]|uniref:Hemagglutinin protein n=1 Tax=Trabulsiella guamensis ATCC 49490 TaxID=1005994 RepID=A0A084ZUB6_9ENTR|nr:hypothetical protein [Trabulsiella guamensis]KFC01061.1 hemagglutinin protein [Trabulsiella guamensis ATCC 49490]